MTTKAEERKALEQIRKIVEKLGENSYIGTAFEGCFEMAEENIENDFGNSAKWYIEKVYELEAERDKVKVEKAAEIKTLLKQIEEYKEDCDELNKRIEKLRKDKFEAQAEAVKARKEVRIVTESGEELKPFAEIRYIDNNGFRFVNVVEESGWTTSYKLNDIKTLEIR